VGRDLESADHPVRGVGYEAGCAAHGGAGTALFCSALPCPALHCTALRRTALQCGAVECSAVHNAALHGSALLCWARLGSALDGQGAARQGTARHRRAWRWPRRFDLGNQRTAAHGSGSGWDERVGKGWMSWTVLSPPATILPSIPRSRLCPLPPFSRTVGRGVRAPHCLPSAAHSRSSAQLNSAQGGAGQLRAGQGKAGQGREGSVPHMSMSRAQGEGK
jgi:hypothetical protein